MRTLSDDPLARSGIDAEAARRAAQLYGTPLFLYSVPEMRERVAEWRELFGDGLGLFFSVKANPSLAVADLFRRLGTGAEVSSGGELELAVGAGFDPADVLFCGPGKTDAELELAVRRGVGFLSVESEGELDRLVATCARLGGGASVVLRVNPGAGAQTARLQMAGVTQFGLDAGGAARALARCLAEPLIEWRGFHCYMGTQILGARQVVDNARLALEMMAALADERGVPVPFADIGGGLGIPYYPDEAAFDVTEMARGLHPLFAELRRRPAFGATRLAMELGRYLVGEAGVYLCRVIDVKAHGARRFVITDGGVNHFLPAGAIGRVVRRNLPLGVVGAGSGTAGRAEAGAAAGATDVVGPLCTPLDSLARGVDLPPVAPGDLIGIPCAGAYGYTASPVLWLSHPTPAEALVEGRDLFLARPAGAWGDFLAGQRRPGSA